jgi:dihydrofolate reductase
LKKPELVLIAALAEENRLIGRGLELPWHIPEDMRRFKQLTNGHPLLMGRKTFESLLTQFGGPLRNRRHIVLTSRPERIDHPVAEVFTSLDDALEALSDQDIVFSAGGATIYAQTLERADRLELTLIEGTYQGDTFFPPYEHLIGSLFDIVQIDQREGYRFVTLRHKDII